MEELYRGRVNKEQYDVNSYHSFYPCVKIRLLWKDKDIKDQVPHTWDLLLASDANRMEQLSGPTQCRP